MSDLTAWQQKNDEFLAAALCWLRLRLRRLARAEDVAPEPPSRRSAWTLFNCETSTQPRAVPEPRVTDEELDRAAAAMKRAAEVEPVPALAILARSLGLGSFEEHVLLLCVGMELDTGMPALCANAQGNASRPSPTFALALSLFDEPVWEALSPERPLRYWKLIEINQGAGQPLTNSALRADERIVNYIKGLNYLDDRLAPLATAVVESSGDLAPSQALQAQAIATQLNQVPRGIPVVHLLGADSAGKLAIARTVSNQLGLELYRIGVDLLPAPLAELESLVRLWAREARLMPVALYLDAHDSEKDLSAVQRFLSRTRGLVFLDTRDPWPDPGRDAITIDCAKPTAAEQAEAWAAILGEDAGSVPGQLSSQFNLNLRDIGRIARSVTPRGGGLADRLWNACLLATRPRLDSLAQRLEPKEQSWDDLVLADTEKRALRQIVDQVTQRHVVYEQWGFSRRMSRGLGISVLFAGESGTGKTMAAEVMARELKLNLYRIDLSQVMSKYIGETSKSLRKLFDAAEDGGTILFFDEADAVFGKRSEVKDSHDRYANIEINYLLQRMEAYRGLAILATNMKSALDTAFLRRLRCIVNFSFPGIPERRAIWQRVYPNPTRVERLDYDRLARFHLTGGSIHNVAMNAAFLAARQNQRVTMPNVLEAVRSEFRKLDKPVNEADFRWVEPIGVGT